MRPSTEVLWCIAILAYLACVVVWTLWVVLPEGWLW
jgi:hypothetical protein